MLVRKRKLHTYDIQYSFGSKIFESDDIPVVLRVTLLVVSFLVIYIWFYLCLRRIRVDA